MIFVAIAEQTRKSPTWLTAFDEPSPKLSLYNTSIPLDPFIPIFTPPHTEHTSVTKGKHFSPSVIQQILFLEAAWLSG